MLSGKLPSVDIQICIGMMRLAEMAGDKLIAERISALIQLGAQVRGYQKEFNNSPLALAICEKKIEFLLQAKSKSDLKEILAPAKVRYNYNEIVPVGKFHVEEEELLQWCLTSLWCGGPLNEAAYKRYMKLMKKLFPDFAKEIGIND